MIYLVEVKKCGAFGSEDAQRLGQVFAELLPVKLSSVARIKLYFLEGLSCAEEAETIARRLLCDPVIERFEVLSDSPNRLKIRRQLSGNSSSCRRDRCGC